MRYFHASASELLGGTVIGPYRLDARIPNAWALLNDEVGAGPVRAMRALKALTRELQSPYKGSSFIEVVAERLREEQFGVLPSRMACSFAMPTLGSALAYSRRFQRGQHVFEVIPVGGARIWFADIEMLSQGPNLDADPVGEFQALVDRLSDYWRGFSSNRDSITTRSEVLFEGSIQVTGPCLAPR